MSDSYERFVAKLKRAHTLGTVAGLLGWDEQVNLPVDSADQRAEQLAVLAELHHTAASDAEIGKLLGKLEGGVKPLTADEAVVVREARRD